MSSGVTSIAWAIVGTAVLRIVVSSDCMKNATATSHGSSRLIVSVGGRGRSVVVMSDAGPRYCGPTIEGGQSASGLVGDLVVGLDALDQVEQLGLAEQRGVERFQRVGEGLAIDVVDYL